MVWLMACVFLFLLFPSLSLSRNVKMWSASKRVLIEVFCLCFRLYKKRVSKDPTFCKLIRFLNNFLDQIEQGGKNSLALIYYTDYAISNLYFNHKKLLLFSDKQRDFIEINKSLALNHKQRTDFKSILRHESVFTFIFKWRQNL